MTSKKRSGVNFKSKPPDPSIFFIERSLGSKTVPEALREARLEVEIHDDHFPQNAEDEVWLREVGRRGWIVLTKDQKIRYRPTELNALIIGRVGAFVLTAGDLQGAEMAEIFIKALPKIRRLIEINSPPYIASVTRSGSVSILFGGQPNA